MSSICIKHIPRRKAYAIWFVQYDLQCEQCNQYIYLALIFAISLAKWLGVSTKYRLFQLTSFIPSFVAKGPRKDMLFDFAVNDEYT